ncbi:Transcription factor TGA like domain [Dillenia turbinata]|uniref:Transcription factor TGA like domain n=1 Tax=Dillenia turbinata TaxID=194707 RepID=A0AAN8VEC9_9MAGN
MRSQIEEQFSDFYEKWVMQNEEYLQQLLIASKDPLLSEQEQRSLISKLTAHHKGYYSAKWASAHEDVLAFFSPPWLSPLENAYSWMTGWKPSIVFRLIDSLSLHHRVQLSHGPNLRQLSDEQVKKIQELRNRIRLDEEKVERKMERQQVALADSGMVELARLASRVVDRGGGGGTESAAVQVEGLLESALKGLLSGLEKVMKSADCVRLKTLKGVLDVLTPLQCLELLVAISMLQVQLRKWGKKIKFPCCFQV